MRWMTQKSIVPKQGEIVSDLVLDALLTLFIAAVGTELIRTILSAG